VKRIELDYAQIAAGIRADPAGAKLRGRDMEKLIRQAIRDKERPGTKVVLVNKPGSIIEVEGGRKYLVKRSGDLQQIAGEAIGPLS
jgi:hypothetical protein